MERMTIINGNGSYRLPLSKGKTIRQEWQQDQPVLFGEPVNKLGTYEDIGTQDEFSSLMNRYGRKRK